MPTPSYTRNQSRPLHVALFSVSAAGEPVRRYAMSGHRLVEAKRDFDYCLRRHLDVFAFELVACVVNDGLCHLVIQPLAVCIIEGWSTREVAERWLRLFHVPPLVRCYLRSEPLTESQMQSVEWLTDAWRQKLADRHFFIKSLNREFPVRLLAAN